MRIVFGADDENECTRAVVDYLRQAGDLRVLSSGSWPEFARGTRRAGLGAVDSEDGQHRPHQEAVTISAP
jgi:hypothetical protein